MTLENRQAWLEMFSTRLGSQKLCGFKIIDGGIFGDGSVSKYPPKLEQDRWTELTVDQVLGLEDVNEYVSKLYTIFKAKQAELTAYVPTWEKALAEYQAKKDEADKLRKEVETVEEIARLKKRVSQLEQVLTEIIRKASDETLEAIGLYHPSSEEEEEPELTEAQREALETLGLDDC